MFSIPYLTASATSAINRIASMRSASIVLNPVSAGNAENIAPAAHAPNSATRTKSVARCHVPNIPDARRLNGRTAAPASGTANANTHSPNMPRTESVEENPPFKSASSAKVVMAAKPENASAIPMTMMIAMRMKDGMITE